MPPTFTARSQKIAPPAVDSGQNLRHTQYTQSRVTAADEELSMTTITGTAGFDATVDFEAPGELETALAGAITELACDGHFCLAVIRVDSEIGELYVGDWDQISETSDEDWVVTGKNAAQLAAAFRALL